MGCGSLPILPVSLPEVPVLKILPKDVGLGHAQRSMEELKANYVTQRNLLLEQGKSEEEAHEEALKHKLVVREIEQTVRTLDWELNMTRFGTAQQAKTLLAMGDANPENDVSSFPGADRAWGKAKQNAVTKAVTNCVMSVILEEIENLDLDDD